ncbi:hypothetical protein C7M84_002451 [Penaeus vannamei]|uniref:CCDC92/74 N-terminal domain-containing protein n=1 Tax=Penaeus vannamei TaxID=6689 RepID=A0A423TQS9_PENVA|nr:hypothetical protein C7M84_002451 [Penaeus vannamei]
MTEKGLTMERSPSSGLGVGVFSPHIGGGGGAWDQQQNAIITKIASTPSNRRSTATDNQERERRRRRSADKNAMNQNRNCGCGGWAHAVQLEHDLTELKASHENLLAGLHQQIESLKQKNRDLTFQVLMGPYAAGVKTDVPLSPESDEVASPKSESSKKIEESAKKEPSPAVSTTSTSTTSTTVKEAKDIKGDVKDSKDLSTSEAPPKAKQEAEELVNGDITRVVRRPYPGRSGRGDPRLVRSLDLELLEEEAIHSRRLLEEERAKNKYLTTLIEDLKRLLQDPQVSPETLLSLIPASASAQDPPSPSEPPPDALEPHAPSSKILQDAPPSDSLPSSDDTLHGLPKMPEDSEDEWQIQARVMEPKTFHQKSFAAAGEQEAPRAAGFSASPHRKRPKHAEGDDARRAPRHHSRKAPLPPLRDYPGAPTYNTRPGFIVKSPGHVPVCPGKAPARTEHHKRARQPIHSAPGSGRRPRSYVYVWNDL